MPLDPVTAADVRACMRGDVYGEAETMTDAWFADHVARNDVDLVRSPRYTVDDTLSAFALLGFRGDRAWVGGFGVAPAFRGEGMGGVCVADVLRIAREAGATTLELEVLEQNTAAIALYSRAGFVEVDELVVWQRDALIDQRPVEHGSVTDTARDAAAVAAIARSPATCWQREPRSVAGAAPFTTLTVGDASHPDAYAFLRFGGPRDVVLDAGARDVDAAIALLDALDEQFMSANFTLLNEPFDGALAEGLLTGTAWWDVAARQRRMRIELR